jgi:hypothetical protein
MYPVFSDRPMNETTEERIAEYRARATEADRLARSTKDDVMRQAFEGIARHWRQLADRLHKAQSER